SGQHSEERLDVGVGADIAVAVEVGGAAGWAAVAGEGGEEGLDVGVGAHIAVAVEVRSAGVPEDVDAGAGVVSDGQVGAAVGVEVPHRHGGRVLVGDGEAGGGPQAASAVAQERGHQVWVAVIGVHHDHVR